VLGLLESDPVSGLKFLQDDASKQVLDPEKHKELLGLMKKRAMNFKDLIEEQQFTQMIDTNAADYEKVKNGAGLDYIENIKDLPTKNVLRDGYLSAHQLTLGEIQDRQADYQQQWASLFVPDKVTGLPTKELKKTTTYKDVIELQRTAAANLHAIRSNAASSALAKELPLLIAQSVANQEPHPKLAAFLTGVSSFHPVADALALFTGKEPPVRMAERIRAEMSAEFFGKLAKVDAEDPVAVQNAIKSVVASHQTKLNPNRAKYLIGEKVSMPAGLLEVGGYDAAGDPLFLKKAKK
jgi:hypothetical protein